MISYYLNILNAIISDISFKLFKIYENVNMTYITIKCFEK